MDRDWLQAQFRAYPDKSKAGLARALGVEPSAVSKILNGTRQIKAAEYVRMRQFFGLPSDGGRTADLPNSYRLDPLPGLSEKASPQGGMDTAQEAWVMPASLLAARTKAPPEQIRIFAIQDQAMMPDYRPGEQVLVDLSDVKPSPPGVFVLSDGVGHIVRQCEIVPNEKPLSVRVRALNSSYESYRLRMEQAGIIGRVIARLQWT